MFHTSYGLTESEVINRSFINLLMFFFGYLYITAARFSMENE